MFFFSLSVHCDSACFDFVKVVCWDYWDNFLWSTSCCFQLYKIGMSFSRNLSNTTRYINSGLFKGNVVLLNFKSCKILFWYFMHCMLSSSSWTFFSSAYSKVVSSHWKFAFLYERKEQGIDILYCYNVIRKLQEFCFYPEIKNV